MCFVTRNCFSCTKTDPIHLLIDHTYVSSPCDNSQYTPAYLNRHCAQPFLYEKKLGYACDLCVTNTRTEQMTKVKEKYATDMEDLQKKLEKLKGNLRGAGRLVSPPRNDHIADVC
jgi:hypothetical protein